MCERKKQKKFPTMFYKILMENTTIKMSSLHGFTFKKGLKDMFSQISRSAGRVPRVRKRKPGLGPLKEPPINRAFLLNTIALWNKSHRALVTFSYFSRAWRYASLFPFPL